MNLYVYYEVPGAQKADVLVRVRALQAALGAHRSRLMRRADRGADVETWMEIYEDVAAGFEARLADAVDAHALEAATGPRHVERFEDLA